jgi:NAD+ synthase (glutamine-hydrolysing)
MDSCGLRPACQWSRSLHRPAISKRAACWRAASSRNAALAVFPELGLTAYANDDLFFQDALLGAAQEAIAELVRASREMKSVLVVGAPIESEAKLFNCAILIYRGRILGVVPKTYLPNYREFYESANSPPAARRARRSSGWPARRSPR